MAAKKSSGRLANTTAVMFTSLVAPLTVTLMAAFIRGDLPRTANTESAASNRSVASLATQPVPIGSIGNGKVIAVSERRGGSKADDSMTWRPARY
jgi:hypothetical protein